MSSLLNRLNVLLGVVSRQNKNCPDCGHSATDSLGSNSSLAHVRMCRRCSLIFRWPKQSASFNSLFYRREYSRIHRSAATDLPDSKQLEMMKSRNFEGTARDFSDYIELFKMLGVKSILDFGCSWGYGTFQFRNAGFDAIGYEVSEPRAAFGRSQLAIPILSSEADLLHGARKFDAVFSSHVLEHLPSPTLAWTLFAKVSTSGTFFLIEVPNCSGDSARQQGLKWGPFSSAIHPLSFTATYFRKKLGSGFRAAHLFSRPFSAAKEFEAFANGATGEDPAGDDLVVLAEVA
jgi:hypothetical protein